jgi:hypothetical protein
MDNISFGPPAHLLLRYADAQNDAWRSHKPTCRLLIRVRATAIHTDGSTLEPMGLVQKFDLVVRENDFVEVSK